MAKWDSMTRKQMEQMQNKKLREFIRHQVYPYSPYYRRIFDQNGIEPNDIKTSQDLTKIPFTYKEDISSAPNDFVLQPNEPWTDKMKREYMPLVPIFTGGRSAVPTPIFCTWHDLDRMMEAGRRLIQVMTTGVEIDYSRPYIVTYPNLPHLGFWEALAINLGAMIPTINTGGGKAMGTERIITLIEATKAQLVTGTTGYIYYLLRRAASEGRDFSHIRLLMLGEKLVPGAKAKMRAYLQQMGAKNVAIVNGYGGTEWKYGNGTCPAEEPTGYHTYPDMEIIEIVDPKTGERVAEGEEGEVVVTNLDARGSVVLRFRTGDIATGGITYEKCPYCGRTVPRISPDIYRMSDFRELNLTRVKGTFVNMDLFSQLLLGDEDVAEWQVEIGKRNDDPFDLDEIWLYITPKERVEGEELKKRISGKLVSATEVSPNKIILCDLNQLEERLGLDSELKERRIVDKRPRR
jgi:phenylacetate-coenzyme A ligase PaaK-like adenylate-forming protein